MWEPLIMQELLISIMQEPKSGRSWTSKVFNTVITLDTYQFYEKIDHCSKFEYIISKIGESPPKCGSSFPNRDPLYKIPLNVKIVQIYFI